MPLSVHHGLRKRGKPAAWRRLRRNRKLRFYGKLQQTIEEFFAKEDRDARFSELRAKGSAVTKFSTVKDRTLWCVVY